jgi:chemotaxis protein histidine kinase CheA
MATDFDININKFRNAEVLDQDNYYNREAQRLAVEQLKIWSGKEEEKPIPIQLTEGDKAKLDKYINRFENAIADKTYDFETEDKNETMLLPKEIIPIWNELVVWFSLNLGIRYKGYLDNFLASPTNVAAVKQLADYAKQYETRDAPELLQLYNKLRSGVYERIPYAYTNITQNEDERLIKQAKKKIKQEERQSKIEEKARVVYEEEAVAAAAKEEAAARKAELEEAAKSAATEEERKAAKKELKKERERIKRLEKKAAKTKEGGGRGLPRINYQQQYGNIMPPDFLDTPNNMASSNPSKVSAGLTTAGRVRPDFTLAGFN